MNHIYGNLEQHLDYNTKTEQLNKTLSPTLSNFDLTIKENLLIKITKSNQNNID